MSTHPAITAAYWTLAGAFPGIEPEYSPFDFEDRVKKAARAGFTGMGFWHADLDHILQSRSLREMKQVLDDNGMKHIEVEFLTDWFLDGDLRKASDLRKKKLLVAAEALGAKHVKVGDFYCRPCSMPKLVDSFAALCKEASEHGTAIAFEPMSVAMIHKIDAVLQMVEGAAAKNGGVILDLWQVLDIGISFAEVENFPAQYLFGVEICDGQFHISEGPSRRPIVNRTFCGEGQFNMQGFVEAIAATGYAGPWGVEIFSRELLGFSLEELATKAFNTSAKFVDDSAQSDPERKRA